MTNKQAYEVLSKNNVHWDRKDATHIVVYTGGNMTSDVYTVAEFLKKAGMVAIDMEFDQVCGKTRTVYRHKKGA